MDSNDVHLGMEGGAAMMIIVNSIFNFATVIVVALRYCSRKLTGADLGWDDYLVFVATLLVNIMLVLAGFLTQSGLGNDTEDVLESLQGILRLMLGFRVVFLLCICLNKLSAILFYQRIFVNREMQIICKVLCTLVVLWSVANFVQEFTICQPLEAFFDGHPCPARQDMDIAVCFFNAFVDILILLLPIRPIWKLQMKKKTKIALTAVFLLGLATTAIALLRFSAIIDTDYEGDMTGTAVPSIMYAILCISLPMLQPLWRNFRTRNQSNRQMLSNGQKRSSTAHFVTRTDSIDDNFASRATRATKCTLMSIMGSPSHKQEYTLHENEAIQLGEHSSTARVASMPEASSGSMVPAERITHTHSCIHS